MIRYGSLFTGAGLWDYALERAIPSLRCEFQVDLDPISRRILAAHWPGVPRFGDITQLQAGDLPAVDGLVGGVPCTTHTTANTIGERGLAPEWTHARRLIADLRPRWTLWESSAKDRSWLRWVPFVRRDLWERGHASVCFSVRTGEHGAPHDRQRAFVISWAQAADAHLEGQPPRAVHAALASLRAAPADLWDGWVSPRAHGRLADGVDRPLAQRIGLGVDARAGACTARVLGALIRELEKSREAGNSSREDRLVPA